MSYNFAPRITIPWCDVSAVQAVWTECATLVVAYEHEADAKVKSTHCHFLILGSTVQEEALKRKFKSVISNIPVHLKGNGLWKWASDYGEPNKKFITYMSKGKLQPKYYYGIALDEIETYRLKWVEPNRSLHDLGTAEPVKYNEWYEIKKAVVADIDNINSLDACRSWTMRWYWSRDGRLPDVGVYKRNASSLWIYIKEKKDKLSGLYLAIEDVKNLWY